MFVLRFLFKTLLSILLLLLILGLGIAGLGIWLSPYFVPKVLDDYVGRKTGFEMVTKKFDMSLFKGTVQLADVTIYNPPEYGERIFLRGKEFFVNARVLSLVGKSTIELDKVIIDIENLTWVRNTRNEINLIEFVNKARLKQNGSGDSSTDAAKPPPSRPIYIKKLIVRLGTISVVGFPEKTSPLQTFNVNYTREFKDVRDIGAVSKEIGLDMAHVGVKVLANGILQSDAMLNLISNLEKTVTEKVLDVLDSTSQKAEKKLKKLQDKLGDKMKKFFE